MRVILNLFKRGPTEEEILEMQSEAVSVGYELAQQEFEDSLLCADYQDTRVGFTADIS